jgi:hypothetical protein
MKKVKGIPTNECRLQCQIDFLFAKLLTVQRHFSERYFMSVTVSLMYCIILTKEVIGLKTLLDII